MDLIIGTAGHIDHGKTALVRALTGIDTDRLPEERERGITVDLGFAEMAFGDLHFGFVDVPGHERFVKNMLAGASGIDVALLVIAADEGVMPQTREHFDILRLLGIRRGLIALTKRDLVDDDTLELARLEVDELVDGSFLTDAEVVAVSTRTGDGLDELRSAIQRAGRGIVVPEESHITRLWIDRSFSAKGFGTVVTGTLVSGVLKTGDELDLIPAGRRVRVRGLQTHGNDVTSAARGQRVAVNLSAVDHTGVGRAMLLAAPGVLVPSQIVDAGIEVLRTSARPIKTRQRVRVHIGTAEILARVQVLNDAGVIEQGASDLVQLRLESPIATVPGERFIIRSYSPSITIAGGEVLDPTATKHRKRDLGAARSYLESLASAATLAERLLPMVTRAGPHGISRSDILPALGCEPARLIAATGELEAAEKVFAAGDRLVAADPMESLSQAAAAAIDRFHRAEPLAKGITRQALRDAVDPHMPEAVFERVLHVLTGSGAVVAGNELVRSAAYRVELTREETALNERLKDLILKAGLEPPKVSDVIAAATRDTAFEANDAQKFLRRLADAGEIVKVSDDHYFAANAIDDLKAKLKAYAAGQAERLIDVPAFKELAGVSRKFAIPLIEYFDRERVTVRRGDKRVII